MNQSPSTSPPALRAFAPGAEPARSEGRIYVLDTNVVSRKFYERRLNGVDWEYVSDFDYDWRPPDDAVLIISAQHYFLPERAVLARLTQENRVPVLILADGILEYRNTFEHPGMEPGAIFQPVLGHKIACLGRSQARILESWGNVGRCEIVGAPSFDTLSGRNARRRRPDQPFEILIMTAKSPGFTPRQTEQALEGLRDLKQWLEQHPVVNGVAVRGRWRVTAGLDEALGVPNELRDLSGQDLAAVLNEVDAVITTPSTAMLEGMLQGVPVALLDYTNSPHYVAAAWNITAPQHLDAVVPELLTPPAAKLLFQDTELHDSLECRTPAGARMKCLIDHLTELARRSRAAGTPLELPNRILEDPQQGHHPLETRFEFDKLYPHDQAVQSLQILRLQEELGRLQGKHEHLQAELDVARDALDQLENHLVAGRILRLRRRLLQWFGRQAA